jgi:hypothetical protein
MLEAILVLVDKIIAVKVIYKLIADDFFEQFR